MKKANLHIDLSDEDLLLRYQSTHEGQWMGALYHRYLHLVYGLCLKYLKSRDDAQDAVMNIYESITEKLKRHEVQHFKSWLYMVAKNHCLMQLRRQKPQENVNGAFMENEPVLHPIMEEDYLDKNLAALEECMQLLREDQQVCVRLFYLEQKSYEEVSQQTTFALKKVKSYIQNGKRNLKICLEQKHVSR